MKKIKTSLLVILCFALVFSMSSAVLASDEPNGATVSISSEDFAFQGQELRNILTRLGVPDTLTVFVEQFPPQYWEAGGRYYMQIDAYYGKSLVATAHVDAYSGELLKNIRYYTPATFSMDDVKQGDWFYGAVKFNYDNALMSGTSKSTFEPNTTTTRAMLATILWRLEGSPAAYGNAFNDLTQDWYKTAVNWAAKEGIVNGYGNGKFGPDDPITREQMATMLYRYAKEMTPIGIDISNPTKFYGFRDYSSVSNYAEAPLQWACSEGFISGMGNNTIAPAGYANRAQLATILERIVRYYFEVE